MAYDPTSERYLASASVPPYYPISERYLAPPQAPIEYPPIPVGPTSLNFTLPPNFAPPQAPIQYPPLPVGPTPLNFVLPQNVSAPQTQIQYPPLPVGPTPLNFAMPQNFAPPQEAGVADVAAEPPVSVPATADRSRVNHPGSWGYIASRMPGEAPPMLPTEPPDVGPLPYGISHFDLPGGVHAYHISQDYQDRVREIDRQQAAARLARDQAVKDAQMLDQMMRVARSTKDIEVARQQIDMQGLQRELNQLGPMATPQQQATIIARHPISASHLGAGYAAALKATVPTPETRYVAPTGGAPGYVLDPRGVPHFPPGNGQQPPHQLGELIPVKDPATGEVIANVIATGPQTGHVQKLEGAILTAPQQVQVQRARITAINAQLANAYSIKDAKERDKFIADKSEELNEISKTLTEMPKGATPRVSAPTKKTVAVPGQGTREDPARPETDEQFQSIPSGAVYKNPSDGKLYRKK